MLRRQHHSVRVRHTGQFVGKVFVAQVHIEAMWHLRLLKALPSPQLQRYTPRPLISIVDDSVESRGGYCPRVHMPLI